MEPAEKPYIYLEHPSELKIRSFGSDLPQLFVNTALAMTDFLFGEADEKAASRVETVEISAENIDNLLIDWLSEILYLSNFNKQAYLNYKILEFSITHIKAEVGSIPMIAKDDIKAVTYSELHISNSNDHWQAEVVFDI